MASPIGPDGFEEKFRSDPDPWNYATSRFEVFKRSKLLQYCGSRCHGRTLELGCANGLTTIHLAARSLRTTAVDASQAALVAAGQHVGGGLNIRLVQGILPNALPHGPFDLIVVSELVYYLPERARNVLASVVIRELAKGGRVVVLDHHIPFDDAWVQPATAHELFIRSLSKRLATGRSLRTGRFQVDVLHRL